MYSTLLQQTQTRKTAHSAYFRSLFTENFLMFFNSTQKLVKSVSHTEACGGQISHVVKGMSVYVSNLKNFAAILLFYLAVSRSFKKPKSRLALFSVAQNVLYRKRPTVIDTGLLSLLFLLHTV